jgi:hypothetical protein
MTIYRWVVVLSSVWSKKKKGLKEMIRGHKSDILIPELTEWPRRIATMATALGLGLGGGRMASAIDMSDSSSARVAARRELLVLLCCR